MAFNKKQHFKNNIKAITLAFQLQKNKRTPLPDEISIFKQYSGFGGLKCVLNPFDIADSWSKSDKDLFPLLQELVITIKDNVAESQFKNYYNSLKNSVLTSFYTPAEITDTLAAQIKSTGLTVNEILDPCAGSGQFLNSFKNFNNNQIQVTGFEKDLLTGIILKSLWKDSTIRIEPYEEAGTSLNRSFDCISSNVPFGDVPAWDPQFVNSKDKIKQLSCRSIHNYFFIKSVDLVKEGGIIAFIVTDSLMNSPSHENIRQYLVKNCNLVSAIRLPSNTFIDIAGTNAGSDLIILQKVPDKSTFTTDEKQFIVSRKLSSGINLNDYFQYKKNRIIHTKEYLDTDQYGKPALVYEHEKGIPGIAIDLADILKQDLHRLNLNLYQSNTKPEKIENKGFFIQGDLFGSPPESIHYKGALTPFLYDGCLATQ